MCPHKPEEGCLPEAKARIAAPSGEELSLDLKRSWMIGDAWSDVQAGQAAGVRQAFW